MEVVMAVPHSGDTGHTSGNHMWSSLDSRGSAAVGGIMSAVQ